MPLSREDKERVLQYYCVEDCSVAEIARRIGTNYSVVYEFLYKNKFTMKRKTIKSQEQEEMIRNLYNSGSTIYEISKSLNLTEETIKKKMSLMKLYESKIYKRLDSDFEKSEIIKYLRKGYNFEEVGNALGMSTTTVSNRVREYNINVIEEKEYYKEYLKDEIEKLMAQGLSRAQIAKQLNITTGYIEKLVGKRNIEKENSIKLFQAEKDREQIVELLRKGYSLIEICHENV